MWWRFRTANCWRNNSISFDFSASKRLLRSCNLPNSFERTAFSCNNISMLGIFIMMVIVNNGELLKG
ncbi:MAG: hypothetical protein RIR79_2319 [Pseudomonadota bacterium]|jgi:hypothetical protein